MTSQLHSLHNAFEKESAKTLAGRNDSHKIFEISREHHLCFMGHLQGSQMEACGTVGGFRTRSNKAEVEIQKTYWLTFRLHHVSEM